MPSVKTLGVPTKMYGPRKNSSPLSVFEVLTLLRSDNRAWTDAEVADAFGLDMSVRDLRHMVTNRLSYLRERGLAHRVGTKLHQITPLGIEIQKQGERTMSVTDIGTADGGQLPTVSLNGVATAAPPDSVCEECGYVARSRMGLAAHITRQHKSKSVLSADVAFERVGQACEVLFPDGVPMARVIEIAELQRAMLKAMTK